MGEVPVIKEVSSGVEIQFHIQPGASKTELVGIHNGAIKVRVHAPPLDGRANEALISFISEQWAVSKSAVHLIRGTSSRKKAILIQGRGLAQIPASWQAALKIR